MEGLTPEQAATAAQWGPDFGPPGPVSYIMHIIHSLEPQDEAPATSGQEPGGFGVAIGNGDNSPVSASPMDGQARSTPTFDTVSESTTMPFSFETSAANPSTTQESSSSTLTTISTSKDTFTSDSATSTSGWPRFSSSIATTSSTSTSVSTYTTGVLSYEPISGSFSFAPTSSFISYSSISTSSSRTVPTDIGSHAIEPASSDMISMPNSRKQAIVGGLAGAIGALVLVGILLCFCLRRRHGRSDDDEDGEDGLKSVRPTMTIGTKPSIVRLWNSLGRGEPARSTPEISRPRTPSPVDGSLIRVSNEHWTRPFVRKEGVRESLEPAPLRVVNANSNSSRSSTPQEDRPQGFVRKQRSALQAFLQDGSHSESRNASKCGPISYPKPMAGDPVYSSKAEVDIDNVEVETHSVSSLPSDTSSLMVVQQPPEDPFYTSSTMLSIMEEVAPPMKPTKIELSRTVSHFGKNANPSGTRIVPSITLPPRVFSPASGGFRASYIGDVNVGRQTMGSNYSRRDTTGTMPIRSSDQFDLMVSPDQITPALGILAKASEYEQREKEKREREQTPSEASSPNWKVYEGT